MKCEICDKVFETVRQLCGHKRIHGPSKGGYSVPRVGNFGSKKYKYDWKEIQKFYDVGNSWRQIEATYGPTQATIGAARRRGDLITTRDVSAATKLSYQQGQRKPSIMSQEARKRVSIRQSLNNSGGKCKWFEVAGQKVQGTWERDMALKFEEMGVNWYKPRVKTDTWEYELDGKQKSYSPDFYLPDEDLYIEVKGYWWGNDKNKMKAVLKQHQDKKLVIIEKDKFYRFMEGEQVW